jgi:hypothetical protein
MVLLNKGKVIQCIQVCWQVDDMNMKREVFGLKSALDFFGLKEGVILTHNQTDLFDIVGTTVKLIPACKYMTER